MNSDSSLVIPLNALSIRRRRPASDDRGDEQQLAESLAEIELAIGKVSDACEWKDVANRRLAVAKRYLQSKEHGACKYELQVIQTLLMKMVGDGCSDDPQQST